MNLEQIQRAMFTAVQQPLTSAERMQRNAATAEADLLIKPNERLTSFERLEIYNRQYWFRLLSAFAEDFPGLQAVIGEDAFDRLALAYLTECPSESFTLRNLGSRLAPWLERHPAFAGRRQALALDLARLEWAEIEAFDLAQHPLLSPGEVARAGEDTVFHLQPYVRLVALEYPADTWLVKLKHGEATEWEMASNAFEEKPVYEAQPRPSLPRRRKTYVAVHRDQQEQSVYFKRLEPLAFALLSTIRSGKTLAGVIEEVIAKHGAHPDTLGPRLRRWFENWSALGWFCQPHIARDRE